MDGFGGLRIQKRIKYSSSDHLEALVGFLGLQLGEMLLAPTLSDWINELRSSLESSGLSQ